MAISNPDYYWERIKDIWKFVLSSFGLAILSEAVFGESGVTTEFLSLIFVLGVIVGYPVFVYYCYKDKQALTTRYKGVNERHWLTIGVFMGLSSGIYAIAYTLIRL